MREKSLIQNCTIAPAPEKPAMNNCFTGKPRRGLSAELVFNISPIWPMMSQFKPSSGTFSAAYRVGLYCWATAMLEAVGPPRLVVTRTQASPSAMNIL